MKAALELHDSRVSRIATANGIAKIHFSHAYVHQSPGMPGMDPGTGWSQEAQLILAQAELAAISPLLPNTISDGYLEVDGIRHELIPLPFSHKGHAKLVLTFVDGSDFEIHGTGPAIELIGSPKFLEDFP